MKEMKDIHEPWKKLRHEEREAMRRLLEAKENDKT